MAANQAQMLMLLNQVTNLENQMKMSNMAQAQPMGMNSNNLIGMMNLLKASKTPSKGGKGPIKPSLNKNANLANLLKSLTGEVQERGRCVWVTGIPEAYQDADKLLNIFGNFGNVRKIVFSEKKPDGALIELDDSRSAVKAVANLSGKKLDGQAIKVSFTKIDNAGIKKDDTKSKDVRQAKENWRYSGNKDSKFRRICMSRLYSLTGSIIVSNIPDGKMEMVKKHIIESGYTVKSIEGSKRPEDKEKPSTGYTMAKVELASVEEAIAAVANLHNSWPKKLGTMKKDRFENSRGLIFSLAGVKRVKNEKGGKSKAKLYSDVLKKNLQ